MRTSDYWRERFVQLEAAQNRLAQAGRQEIERHYRRAQRELDEQIRVWYQRLADNNKISLAEARRWLTGQELAEFKWDVQEYIKRGMENGIDGRWAKQLENASARFHISRLEALKIRTRQSMEQLFARQQGIVGQTLADVYRSGYYHTAFELQRGFALGWDIAGIDQRQLEKVLAKPWAVDGKNFSERIWGNKDKLIAEVHNELTRNIMLGQDPQKAIDAIAKKLNTSRVNAGRLVMTEEAYFSSLAQRDCFRELGVEQFEIVATLDSHTSEICQELDGEVKPMSDFEPGVTAPPFHVNCRSTTVPYFNDEFTQSWERAARDSETGKTYYVPADMKYKDWQQAFVEGGDKNGLQEAGGSGIIKNIKDCTTVDEVEALMKEQGWFYQTVLPDGTDFDGNKLLSLQGCDLEAAKAVFQAHENIYNKLPELIGKLNAVNAAELANGCYAQCSYGLGRGGITVNTSYFGDASKVARLYENDLVYGFHPANTTFGSIVTHELGHAVDDYLSVVEQLAGMKNTWQAKKVSAYLRPRVMKACGMKIADIQREVSGYATQDAQEWFAECFCEWMDSPRPRPVAAEFGRQLMELMKGVNK